VLKAMSLNQVASGRIPKGSAAGCLSARRGVRLPGWHYETILFMMLARH